MQFVKFKKDTKRQIVNCDEIKVLTCRLKIRKLKVTKCFQSNENFGRRKF